MSTLRAEGPRAQNASSAVARIYPMGPAAEEALDRLVKSNDTSAHHRSFIHLDLRTGKPATDQTSKEQADLGSGGAMYDTWIPQSERDPQFQAGHFLLSYDDPHVERKGLTWRAGRGSRKLKELNRGVELLVVSANQKGHQVAAQHARIRFDLRSGVLMLCGIHNEHPVHYFLDDETEPIELLANEEHYLLKTVNRFKLGRLEFRLVYEHIDGQGYTDYVRIRNTMFEADGLSLPHPRLRAVPSKHRKMVGTAVLHEPLSSGTFGMVYAAVHSRTGEPLAVKEIQIKAKHTATSGELPLEIKISTCFQVWRY